jgi:FkbM family methyltransferase
MLSMLKRFKAIKDLLLEKLDNISADIASLLKSSIHTVEQQSKLLQAQQQLASKQSLSIQQQDFLRQEIKSLKQHRHGEIELLSQRISAQLSTFEQQQSHLLELSQRLEQIYARLEEIGQRRVVVACNNQNQTEPEVRLMSYLSSYLQSHAALDIGANTGSISEQLLLSGYEVYAFEPFLPVFGKLKDRLSDYSHFHPFNLAIGAEDGEQMLHLAEDLSNSSTKKYQDASLYSTLAPHSMLDDLQFTQAVQVQVRSLESLHRSSEIPEKVGLVKIDTEGFDLEVIRGMGNNQYPLVVTEYWDAEHPFGKVCPYQLPELVKEMRQHGYNWYIVIYHYQLQDSAFYCNYSQSVPGTWGNVFFFQEHTLFSHALNWCSAMLPTTFFKN